MGQYHRTVNIDAKQYLDPHSMGLGAKLSEFGESRLTACLVYLLAVSNGRGGGDINSDNGLIGSWAGERIAVVGDYWEEDEAKERGIPTWETMKEEYTNISMDILAIACQADDWLRQSVLEDVARYDFGRDWSSIFTEEELKAKRAELAKEK